VTSGNVKDDVLVIASKPLVLGAQKPRERMGGQRGRP
jgi:hypothetical protein